jgi:radical SAM protein with 4Fe4S-binding SPASM domain
MNGSSTVGRRDAYLPISHSLSERLVIMPSTVALEKREYLFSRAPMLVYWEMTRACDLACRHCRADAIPRRHPLEMTEADGRAMLQDALDFGTPLPHFVFTGGDPFKRPDLLPLVREARRLGGANAEHHDAFRGVTGCFDQTLRAARWIQETGSPLQINTLVTSETADDLPALADLIAGLGITRWSLFFLISVGRARAGLTELSPVRTERLFRWLEGLSRLVPYAIKTTEAMHYRRVALKRMRNRGMDDATIAGTPTGRGFGIRDGNGIMFVSHTGDVFPSGFLPLLVGNVRQDNIVSLYQNHPVFTSIRDVGSLKGKCAECEFATICGGSRARAFAATGDYLESDPLCLYRPGRRSA